MAPESEEAAGRFELSEGERARYQWQMWTEGVGEEGQGR